MRDLKLVEGGREEDLVTTLIRAIGLAKSSRSHTTVYLLKMALLNEGVELATVLSRKAAVPPVRKEFPVSLPNLDNAERILGSQLPSLHSARRVVARPR
jgi:hypothetical protein